MKTKNETVVDRRIQKTKKSLTEALIHLILEKGYEKITVQHLIDKANVGRSTFYTHYESKEQLLLDGHNNLNVEMFSIEVGSGLNFENLFNHVTQNQKLAKAMLGKKSGNIMAEFFKNNLAQKIKKRYSNQFDKTKKERKHLSYLSDATGAALISVMISWIEEDMPFTVKEMSELCKSIVTPVFENALK